MGDKGVTLIELIIVISILAIILTIAIPKGDLVLAYKEREDLIELKNDITYARNMAICDVKRYSVDIYPKEGFYKICKYEKYPVIVKKKNIESSLKILYTNFDNSTSYISGQLMFTPTGAPSRGGRIVMENKKAQRIDLTIEPVTGKINIIANGEVENE